MRKLTDLAMMWKKKELSTTMLKDELEKIELFIPVKFDGVEPSIYSSGDGTSLLDVEFFVFPEEPELFREFEAIVIEVKSKK